MINLSKNKYLKSLLVLLVMVFVFAPLLSQAQVLIDPNQAIPVPYEARFGFCFIGICIGGPAGQGTVSGFIISLINIALAVAGLVAVFFLIVGGYRYVTAQGGEEQIEEAKKTIRNAIIGIVIVILSFVIVRVIVNALAFGAV